MIVQTTGGDKKGKVRIDKVAGLDLEYYDHLISSDVKWKPSSYCFTEPPQGTKPPLYALRWYKSDSHALGDQHNGNSSLQWLRLACGALQITHQTGITARQGPSSESTH